MKRRYLILAFLMAFVWVSQGFRTLSGAELGLDDVMQAYHSAGHAKLVYVPDPGAVTFVCNDGLDDCICEQSLNAECTLQPEDWIIFYRARKPVW